MSKKPTKAEIEVLNFLRENKQASWSPYEISTMMTIGGVTPKRKKIKEICESLVGRRFAERIGAEAYRYKELSW